MDTNLINQLTHWQRELEFYQSLSQVASDSIHHSAVSELASAGHVTQEVANRLWDVIQEIEAFRNSLQAIVQEVNND
jgi:hypothetical protein